MPTKSQSHARSRGGIILGWTLVCSTICLTFPAASQAVIFNLTFTPRWLDQANWPGANQAQRELNRDIATADVFQASFNWQQSITSPFNLAVEVDWNVPMAFFNDNDLDVCGVGGVINTQNVGGSEKPMTAKIILNQLQADNFFFDPTPAVHEEFINTTGHPWQGSAWAGSPAAGKTDFLSCAKHEFGHTLGFMRGAANTPFGPYTAETNDGFLDLTDFTQNGNPVVLPFPVGLPLNDYNASSHFKPNVAAPDLFVPGFGLITNINTNDLLMAPDLANGQRVAMSPFDISAAAKVLGLANGLGYNLNGKSQVIPEPATASLLGAAALVLLKRRRSSN